MVYGVAHGPTLYWLRGVEGGVKGGRGRCRGNHGREEWIGNIYGGDEGRRNIMGREGWLWEIYEGRTGEI